MAATAKWYGKAIAGQYGATAANRVDWATDTIKVALVSSSYTPDQDNDTYFSTPATYEVTGTGYTAGGATLGTKSVNYDAASNVTSLRAATTTWSSATVNASYAVIYKSTGTNSTSPLLGYVDLGGAQSVVGADFSLVWDPTAGVLKITAS